MKRARTSRCACLLVATCAFLLGACNSAGTPRPSASAKDAKAPLIAEGERLLAHFECARCHRLAEHRATVQMPPESRACVGCHQRILLGEFDAPNATLAPWQDHIRASEYAIRWAPPLGRATRLRRGWIERFLLRPVDLRPHLGPMMPRLAIDEAQAAALAAALSPSVVRDPPPSNAAMIAQGRALVENGTCGGCHLYAGRSLGSVAQASTEARERAPDLMHARRLRRDDLIGWLLDPGSIDARTLMPPTGYSLEQAEQVAAFLQQEPEPPEMEPEARLPLLEREVAFSEVEARVFRRICWHCHGDAAYARGEGGPGNSGGFGFPARHINLASYEGVMSGGIDAEGRHYSILEEVEFAGERMPKVVAHMWARHREVAGHVDDAIRGMPLGLPPMSRQEIQLVETWVAQGARRAE